MKFKLLRLWTILVFFWGVLSSHAYDFEVDGFYYETNLEQMTATLVAGENNYSGTLILPETVEYKNRLFTVIGIEGAFKNCTSLESVAIPESIKILGKDSFYGCTSLNTILNASGVFEINDYCFYNCTSITTFPDFLNLNSIGSYAFSNCKNLESITFNNKLNVIGEYAFSNCENLKNFFIPDNVLTLPTGIFSGCRSIGEFNLPSNLQSINDYAFRNCSSITSLTIPPSVTKIGNDCFTGCTHLSELIIQDSNNSLSLGTKGSSSPLFEDCPLSVITIGRDLKYPRDPSNIGITQYYSPFSGNSNIKTVIFGKGITTLYYYLFKYCTGISHISFPSNLKKIYYGVFLGCTNLSSVVFEDSFSGISFDTNDLNPAALGVVFMNDCPISDLYLGRPVLTSGKGSSRIGYSALYLQTNIKKIQIGDFVSNIDCLLYTESGKVGTSLERYSKLEDLKVGASLTFVPNLSSNTNLTHLSLFATTPQNASAFSNSQYINLIPNIPTGSLEAYKSANIWKEFWDFNEEENLLTLFDYEGIRYHINGDKKVEIIKKPSVYSGDIIIPQFAVYNSTNYSIESINEDAFANSNIISVDIRNSSLFLPNNVFSGCSKLQSANLIEGITEIPSGCFLNCSSLSVLNIPPTITSIGATSFKGCVSLECFKCPESLLFIGDEAFANCTSLNDFQINESLSSMGSAVFSGCSEIEEFSFNSKIIIIPENAFNGCSNLSYLKNTIGITLIEASAFEGCKNLNSFNFPSVISISDNAFKNCVSLNELTLGKSLTGIGSSAFYGCSSLETISIPNSVINFGASVFSGCSSLKELVFEDGDQPLSFGYGSYDGATSVMKKEVNGKTIQYKIQYYNGCFSGLSIERLYLGRNISDSQRYTITGDGGVDYYLITSYDGPFNSLSKLKELIIGENVSILGPLEEYISQVDMYVTPGSFKNCSSIQKIDVQNTVPPTGAEFSSSVYSKATLFVPANTQNLYKVADGWKEFINIYSLILPGSIELNHSNISVGLSESYQLEATVLPDDTTDKTIIWSSDNTEIATVSETGLVYGAKIGKTTITAKCGEVSTKCEVEVIPILAEEIVLNEATLSITKGAEFQLKASVKPDNVTDNTIIWSSGNDKIASVSNSGVVKGIEIGSTTITATCGNISATCEITVTDENGVESILNDDDTLFNVYSLSGILIKENLTCKEINMLAPGIYIIRSNKGTFKINI